MSIYAILAILTGIADLVAILDYFGIKPKGQGNGSILPSGRTWKLALMLSLLATTMGLAAYSFYLARRPRIVEKTVEKPVDRLVEKVTSKECPPPSVNSDKRKTIPHIKGPTVTKKKNANQPPIQQDCGGGNCAASVGQQGGITAGQINVNGPLPPVYKFTEEAVTNADRKKINVHVHTDRPVTGAIVGMLFSGPIDYVQTNNPMVINAAISQQNWGQLQKDGIPIPNSLFVTIDNPTVFMPNQELIVPVTSEAEVHVLKVFPVGN